MHSEALTVVERSELRNKTLQETLALHDQEVQRLQEMLHSKEQQHQATAASLKDAYQRAESDCQETHRQLQKTKDALESMSEQYKAELKTILDQRDLAKVL